MIKEMSVRDSRVTMAKLRPSVGVRSLEMAGGVLEIDAEGEILKAHASIGSTAAPSAARGNFFTHHALAGRCPEIGRWFRDGLKDRSLNLLVEVEGRSHRSPITQIHFKDGPAPGRFWAFVRNI